MDKNQKELISTYFRKRDIINNKQPYNKWSCLEFDFITSHPEFFNIENMSFSYSSIIDEIIKHPESIENYNFKKDDYRLISHKEEILKYIPKLIPYLNLENVHTSEFIDALYFRPELIKIIPEDKKKDIEKSTDLENLILHHPKLGYFFNLKSINEPEILKQIIIKSPSLANKLNLTHLRWYDMFTLLQQNPELSNYLNFDHIPDDDIAFMLSDLSILYYVVTNPGNKLKSKLSLVADYTIGNLIIEHPDIVKYIDKDLVNNLHSIIKYRLFMSQPELAKEIDASNMFTEAVKELIIKHPKIIYDLKYNFSNLYSFDIEDILIIHPELFDYIYDKVGDNLFNKFTLKTLYNMIGKQPLLGPKLMPHIKKL
jgi:hypothetical protein